jgi:Flp pilus assembly protein TadG
MVCRQARKQRRRGVAAVELAILLPLLGFLFVVAIDFARIFYYCVVVTNCARDGALYASDSTAAVDSPFKSTTEAALADASALSPAPTVSSKTVSDADGDYVEVTVTYKFTTITNYPLVPRNLDVTKTCRMRMVAATPKF